MPRRVTIRRPERPIDAGITLPRSKSIANRALIIASLAGDLSCVKQRGDADDTRILHDLLLERPRVMHCGLGGTTLRFLLAWACVQDGEEHLITGGPRLLERPHGTLVEALRFMGADIRQRDNGFLVRGKKVKGEAFEAGDAISSQYVSALMMIAPYCTVGVGFDTLKLRNSRPYVDMTAQVMRHFGVATENLDLDDAFVIRNARYRPSTLFVPQDWSAASFWYEIVALATDARVVLNGLRDTAWQGDAAAQRLWAFAVRTSQHADGLALTRNDEPERLPMDIDLHDTPDLLQPLAATLAGRGQQRTITVPAAVRLKESDRLATITDALRALGFEMTCTSNELTIQGRLTAHEPAPFDPFNDHRLAMCLAPLALLTEAITITDADVVNKSYPHFWDDLARAGFRVAFA